MIHRAERRDERIRVEATDNFIVATVFVMVFDEDQKIIEWAMRSGRMATDGNSLLTLKARPSKPKPGIWQIMPPNLFWSRSDCVWRTKDDKGNIEQSVT